MPTEAGRLVLDTNVLISAMLQSKGPPRAVLERVRGAGGVLLFCDETFEEVRTRIMRPKFERYVPAELREAFVRDLLPVSDWVSITGMAMGCRDPDDDKFLELALAGQGDAIVTGDGDLLALHPFQDVPILRPTTFLEMAADS